MFPNCFVFIKKRLWKGYRGQAGCWILDAGYWMLDAGCWIAFHAFLKFDVK
jgi:hypothetical protein